MTVDNWNRVNEDAGKDEKKYDYKSLAFEKTFINDADNVSNESSNLENGVYKPTTANGRSRTSKRIFPILLALVFMLVIIWLLVLTLIREQQLRSMKESLYGLRSDVDILKKRLLEDDLIDDVKAFEDAIYADPNAEDNLKDPSEGDDSDFFLNGDPPSEDEDIGDDDLIAESGDWAYEDDDEDRSIKVDFDLPEDGADVLGEVMEGKLESGDGIDEEDMVHSRKVLRILKDDAIDQERTKREVIDQTKDGVLVLSESYGVSRLMNDSVSPGERTRVFKALQSSERQTPKMIQGWEEKTVETKRNKPNHPKKYHQPSFTSDHQRTISTPTEVVSDQSSTSHPALTFRRSRVMKTDEDQSQAFRRIMKVRKPMLRNGHNSDASNESGERVRLRRRRKQRPSNSGGVRNLESLENLDDVEMFRGPLESGAKSAHHHVAAHFNGDTTGYVVGQHPHFQGNGRLRHPHDTPYAAWKAAPWVRITAADRLYRLAEDGSVTIAEDGIYLIYAQILFHDEHDTNSFKVYRSDGARDETLLQCTTTVHSTTRIQEKASTCFTAGAVHLRAGDRISLMNLGSMRYSLMETAKSFFGFVKLGDLGHH